MKKYVIILALVLILLLLFCLYGYWTNRQLEKETISIKLQNLPTLSDRISILHVSDIHYGHLRVNHQALLDSIAASQPDVIFITGDTVDRTEDVTTSGIFDFIDQIAAIAPTYVIEGNHERTSGQYEEWRQRILKTNTTLLENEVMTIEIKGEPVTLIGLLNDEIDLDVVEKEKIPQDTLRLMLAHHPENIEEYTSNFQPNPPHLVFSGHAHGGQIRLKFVDGILSPDQGFFPKYTNGKYSSLNSTKNYLIVSRGLSNSKFPFRINNKPHLINVIIEPKS